MALVLSVFAVLAGYVTGSVPSAYVVARLRGVDLLEAGDCSIGTSTAVRRLGLPLGMVVGAMDFLKGISAVLIAQAIGAPRIAVFLAGLAAVTGHNWSMFLGFRGGRGAMASYGVLFTLAPVQFAIALVLGGLCLLLTRRTTLATFVLLASLSALLWAGSFNLPEERDAPLLFVLLPLLLFLPMALKPTISKCG